MAESDDENGEGFTSRWSRRKRETQVKEPAEPLAPAGPEAAPAQPLAPAAAGEAPTSPSDSEVPELPDPDTLDAEADFTVFLKDNVPEALRRRALRRLWRLDPVLANLDGLNDYDDDFTDAAMVVEGLKTLYKVGKGFVTDEDDNKADEKPEEAPPDGGEIAAETPDEATAELERGPDSPGDETEDGPRGSASQAASAPVADEVTQIAVSGPGNRRRGALARRWGTADD
jgi:Protein of unknown function (DUF3306)